MAARLISVQHVAARNTGRVLPHLVRRIYMAQTPIPTHSTNPATTPLLPYSHQQRRWHTTPQPASKVYNFEEIKSHTQFPNPQRILIDVREPSEYSAGYIPGAFNMPIKSAPDALFLPAEEFVERFGFEKPDVNDDVEVVFYCRSGVRSSAAAKLAEQAGFKLIAEYRGSWLDWEKSGGKVEKP